MKIADKLKELSEKVVETKLSILGFTDIDKVVYNDFKTHIINMSELAAQRGEFECAVVYNTEYVMKFKDRIFKETGLNIRYDIKEGNNPEPTLISFKVLW